MVHDDEIVTEEENKDEFNIESYGILKLKRDNLQIYIDSALKDEKISDEDKVEISSQQRRPGSLVFDAEESYALRKTPKHHVKESWTYEIVPTQVEYGQNSGRTDYGQTPSLETKIINVDKFMSPWQKAPTIDLRKDKIDSVSQLQKIVEVEQDYGQMASAPSDSDVETYVDVNQYDNVDENENKIKKSPRESISDSTERSIDSDDSFTQKPYTNDNYT